MQFIDLL